VNILMSDTRVAFSFEVRLSHLIDCSSGPSLAMSTRDCENAE
jgi:hypothetical protein